MMRAKHRYLLMIVVAGILVPILIYILWFQQGHGGDVMGFTIREAKLAQRVREVEEQNRVLSHQLSKSQNQLVSLQSMLGGDRKNLTAAGGTVRCYSTEPDVPKCEVIHIALVCGGYNASRDVMTLIKSILFYRKNPLHFHFITDSAGELILKNLFRTWSVPSGNGLHPDWLPTYIRIPEQILTSYRGQLLFHGIDQVIEIHEFIEDLVEDTYLTAQTVLKAKFRQPFSDFEVKLNIDFPT